MYVHGIAIHNGQQQETTKRSINSEMDEPSLYTHRMEYYQASKGNEVLTIYLHARTC